MTIPQMIDTFIIQNKLFTTRNKLIATATSSSHIGLNGCTFHRSMTSATSAMDTLYVFADGLHVFKHTSTSDPVPLWHHSHSFVPAPLYSTFSSPPQLHIHLGGRWQHIMLCIPEFCRCHCLNFGCTGLGWVVGFCIQPS